MKPHAVLIEAAWPIPLSEFTLLSEDVRIKGVWQREVIRKAHRGKLRGLHIAGHMVGDKFRQEAMITPAFKTADTMSDEQFSTRVSIDVDSAELGARHFTGCGRPLH